MGAHLLMAIEGDKSAKMDRLEHDQFDELAIRLDQIWPSLANGCDTCFDGDCVAELRAQKRCVDMLFGGAFRPMIDANSHQPNST